jgi:hypothetical protein
MASLSRWDSYQLLAWIFSKNKLFIILKPNDLSHKSYWKTWKRHNVTNLKIQSFQSGKIQFSQSYNKIDKTIFAYKAGNEINIVVSSSTCNAVSFTSFLSANFDWITSSGQLQPALFLLLNFWKTTPPASQHFNLWIFTVKITFKYYLNCTVGSYFHFIELIQLNYFIYFDKFDLFWFILIYFDLFW